jgi:adenylate kinase
VRRVLRDQDSGEGPEERAEVSIGMVVRRINGLLLIGPTGVGKTPLGDHLALRGYQGRSCRHFDFGCELRTLAAKDAPPEGFSAEEHRFVRGVLKEGLLLEREQFPLARKIVEKFLIREKVTSNDCLVFNGLPRHRQQAEDLETIAAIESLIVLECSAGVVRERIRSNTGNDRTGREDDSLDLVARKLEIFRQRTAPLIDFYERAGAKVVRVEVTALSTAADVYASLF